MKAARLLLLLISSGTLTLGTTLAVPAQQTSPSGPKNTISDHPQGSGQTPPLDEGNRQKQGKPSEGAPDNRKVSGKNHRHSTAPGIKAPPKQLPNNRERFQPGNAANSHDRVSVQRSVAAKAESTQRQSVNRTLPVRSAKVTRPTVPPGDTVRHRGANPAIVIGSAASTGRNTAAVNGTSMHRRP